MISLFVKKIAKSQVWSKSHEGMDLKIICFDTCTLRGVPFTILNKDYPQGENRWATTETIDLELKDQGKNENDKLFRERTFNALINNEINVLLQPGLIMQLEIKRLLFSQAFPESFPFYSNSIQKQRFQYINEGNEAALKKLETRIKKQKEAQIAFWDSISFTKQPISITHKDLNKCVSIFQNDTLITSDETSYDINKLFVTFQDKFVQECPATYNLICLNAFISLLRKTPESSRKFTVFLDSEKVCITPSTISDLKIAFAVLPYVDKFITSDNPFKNILNFLYPSLNERIVFLPLLINKHN